MHALLLTNNLLDRSRITPIAQQASLRLPIFPKRRQRSFP